MERKPPQSQNLNSMSPILDNLEIAASSYSVLNDPGSSSEIVNSEQVHALTDHNYFSLRNTMSPVRMNKNSLCLQALQESD